MKPNINPAAITIFLVLYLTIFTACAQTNIIGEWKIVKYEMEATRNGEMARESREVTEPYVYEFTGGNIFTGTVWLNPFKGGLKKTKLNGTYILTGNELKITCKKDDENINSYFYYEVSTDNDYLILTFDKSRFIKWFKDSDNPNDSFARQMSQDMFSAINCKIYLQKLQ